jgi:hypothetical protein
VAKALFEQWFCKFGIPARNSWQNCVNCTMSNIPKQHLTTYHPQCNTQVEVFNKTVKKYLASYVDETTLNWDEFSPALMLVYKPTC